MTYSIGYPSGTLNTHYSRTKKQPQSATNSWVSKLSGPNSDQVQFGMRNRALEAKRAKRLKNQENRNLQQAEVEEVEKHIAELYEDNLHVKDKRAFEDEVINLLEEYPSMSMNFSFHPDSDNKNKVSPIPFLHFAMANKCFKLAGYILYRDDNLDLTKKNYKGHTALQVAEIVAQYAREDELDDADECAHYADWLRLKSEDYLLAHPEKRTGAMTLNNEEPSASSAIQLKGYSEKELEQFIESNGADADTANPSAEKPEGASAGQLSKAQKKKQKAAERRTRQEQAEKEKRSAEIQKKKEDLDARLEALSVSANKQQAQNAELEANEKALRKTRELNARLNAMPEMHISEALLEDSPDESEAEWKTVKTADKTSSKKQAKHPPKANRPSKSQPPKKTSTHPFSKQSSSSQAVPQNAKAQATEGLRTAKPIPPLPSELIGEGKAKAVTESKMPVVTQTIQPDTNSPEALSPLLPAVESETVRLEDLLQETQSPPVVKLPDFKNPFASSVEAAKAPLSPSPASLRNTERSSHVRSFSMSSKQSQNSMNSRASVLDRQKIEKLKQERDEKQLLLEQASAFNKRTSLENQETMNTAFRAFNEASQALARAEQLQMEKSLADRNAFHWQDVAMNWQQAAQRQARYHQEELNTLKKAYNAQRSELLKLQEAAQQQKVPVENDRLEAGIGVLETMQGEIKHREDNSGNVTKQPPFSKDPNDYAPCPEGGFKILKGFGQGSWVPHRPSGK